MNIVNSYWLALVFFVLVTIIGSIYISRKKRLENRASILKLIIKINIPEFLDRTHLSPVDKFLYIERMIKKYKYTEQELGISLQELLRQANICQLKILENVRGSIESFRRASIVHGQTDVSTEDWAYVAKTNIHEPLDSTLKTLTEEFKNMQILGECNERYRDFKSSSPLQVAPPKWI